MTCEVCPRPGGSNPPAPSVKKEPPLGRPLSPGVADSAAAALFQVCGPVFVLERKQAPRYHPEYSDDLGGRRAHPGNYHLGRDFALQPHETGGVRDDEGVACDQLPLDALERGLSEFGPKVVLRLHPLDHALGLGRLGSPFPLLARAFDPDLV